MALRRRPWEKWDSGGAPSLPQGLQTVSVSFAYSFCNRSRRFDRTLS